MNTRIPAKMEWIRIYLELGMSYIPEGKFVERVGFWSINRRYGKGVQAAIFTYDHKRYRIYLHTMYHPRTEKTPLPLSRIDILANFAHELAHLIDFDHSIDHKKLETRILNAFMTQLKSEGYVSEEVELSGEAS